MKGRFKEQIPKPPLGWIEFKPKNEIKNKGTEMQYSMMICPYCGKSTGWSWGGMGKTKVVGEGDLRMDSGECADCGEIIKHDWDAGTDPKTGRYIDGHYYYKPKGTSTLMDF